MPKFACNVSLLFSELNVSDRFKAAAKAGFSGIEFQFPYELDAEMLERQLEINQLQFVLCNTPPGDLRAGERGFAAIPGRENDFIASLDRAISFATYIGCPRIHVMAGVPPKDLPIEACRTTFINNLKNTARRAEKEDLELLIEPINNIDMPGYFLHDSYEAASIISEINEPNVQLQLDLYHVQMMRGQLSDHIDRYLPITGHIQIAGVPGRHEPNWGEINYPYLFELLDNRGYTGWVGCEYTPKTETSVGLSWFSPYRIS